MALESRLDALESTFIVEENSYFSGDNKNPKTTAKCVVIPKY